MNQTQLLEELIAVARHAGDVIMKIYATDFAVHEKRDDSPVTAADERAEAVIAAALRQMTPDIPIVAEEAMAAGKQVSPGRQFWLVDPLDGTKEFVSRNGEFTVNIALIQDGAPVLGVVYAPVTDTVFAGSEKDGAFIVDAGAKRAISVRDIPDAGAVVLTSRSHSDHDVLHKRLEGQAVADWRLVGSSLKICLIAAGEGDLYPRLGRTMEWDTAAGHAVLRAAGGRLMVLEGSVTEALQDGRELRYGKPGFENPNFLACA
ncbi:MAG: 3'(2'),5'-bisphosphate nucleotidase CysQ [Pseudomonadota bacterium]|nr:3'(2'),5'-bisphosphate nucleotidase CysQ [Pseudomonadota bacterium]